MSAPPSSSPDVSLKLHSWCRLELFHQSYVPGCSRTLDCRFHMKGNPIIDGFVCLFWVCVLFICLFFYKKEVLLAGKTQFVSFR